ncbi:MAG: PQQ-binding-like beta-propeller repeat protein [Nitriliruptoraceae bacterium]|nr:PQQ-binding-like beta-propeller repeat protein [Nitriliruptoraceae bacterium]
MLVAVLGLTPLGPDGGILVRGSAPTGSVDGPAAGGPAIDEATVALDRIAPAERADARAIDLERPVCLATPDCISWSVEVPGRGPVWRDASSTEGLLLLTDRLGTLALDLDDGRQRWRIEADPTAPVGTRSHATSDGVLLRIERDAVVMAHDLEDGARRWRVPFPGATQVRQARTYGDTIVVTADTVVVTADSVVGARRPARVVAGFEAATGALRWHHAGGHVSLGASGPVLADEGGRVRLVDPEDGVERWRTDVGGGLASLRTVGGAIVVTGWAGTRILDASIGELVQDLPGPVRVVLELPELLVAVGAEQVHLLDGEGARWSTRLPDLGTRVTVGADGEDLHVRDEHGRWARLGLDDGRVRSEGSVDPGAVRLAGPLEIGARADARGAEFAPLEVRRTGDAAVLATTPPGDPLATLDDGVVIGGSGWAVRFVDPDRTAPTGP